jgi:acetoin utilization deacetylase AcuC-like enzyme
VHALAGAQGLKVFYSDQFVFPLPEGHRFPMVKYSLLRERVAAAGICELRVPRPVSDEEILRAHERTYLRRVVGSFVHHPQTCPRSLW